MQERQVTIGERTFPLPEPFLVMATQNPIEQEGTYPLPEAQLDRFLLKVRIGYPSRPEELEIVRRHGHRTAMPRIPDFGVEPVADRALLSAARQAVAAIRLSDPVAEYVVDLVRATREHPSLSFGASPRAANMLAVAARAAAALAGRGFSIPDDVKAVAETVLCHRLVVSPHAQIEGVTAGAVLRKIIEEVPAPR
jgi:MoxR-like ATPase